jgi:hypothetical protein
MRSHATTRNCKKCLIVAGLVELAIVLLALFGINAYFYLNPLDEPGVGFQVYLPSALPGIAKIATTDAKIVALKRDPRHDRKDWLGRDLDAAKLEVTMKDSTGKYVANIVEEPEFTTNCTPRSQGYRTTTKGLAYCLRINTQKGSVTSTSLDLSFHPSINVSNSTSVVVSVETPSSTVINDKAWGDYVDSFQKRHLFNVPVESHTDPMEY